MWVVAQLIGSSSSHHSAAPYLSGESSVASLPTSFFVFVSFSLYCTRHEEQERMKLKQS